MPLSHGKDEPRSARPLNLTFTKDGNLMSFTKHKRVGIVGLLHSGKTVLLTSVIAHLQNHDKQKLKLRGGNAEVVGHEKRPPRSQLDEFPFEEIRQRLGNRLWPEKTLKAMEHRSRNVLIDNRQRHKTFDLSLFDIPGERLADLIIADCKTFDEWSDRVLRMLGNNPHFRRSMQPYFDLSRSVDQGEHQFSEEEFILEYKRGLAGLCFDYTPIVTPSSFLITPDGQHVRETLTGVPKNQWIEKLAETRPCGRALDRQFVPLDSRVRASQPKTVAVFRKHYTEYRTQDVLPFAKRLKHCDELLVPVNIPLLLRNGPSLLNAQAQLLEIIFDYLKPGFGTIGSWANRFNALPGIRRVMFVATKADCVAKVDHDALLKLLRGLTQIAVKKQLVRRFDIEYLFCAAVVSTAPYGDDPRGLTWEERNGHSSEPTRFHRIVPALPSQWPNRWEPKDFDGFPDPDPWMPETLVSTPDHLALEDIVDRLLS